MDFNISGFAGMDNLQDAARLKGPTASEPTSAAESVQIVNFDVSDTISASTRGGVSKFYSGTPHSIHHSGLFVEGSSLKMLLPDFSTVITVCPLQSPSSPMSYAPVNYLTVCSNGVDLFMVQSGVITPFSAPTANFKEAIQPAQIVFYFGRRLYYAVGPALYYSDADNIEQADTRDNPFVFNKPITMALALDNGIYVGADKVYWLAGRTPEEMTTPGVAYDGTAIMGTGVTFDGSLVGGSGKVGMFTATDGICICSDGGQIENITLKKISFSNGHVGAALIKQRAGQQSNINQYISWV